jgi:hypothetical protein
VKDLGYHLSLYLDGLIYLRLQKKYTLRGIMSSVEMYQHVNVIFTIL